MTEPTPRAELISETGELCSWIKLALGAAAADPDRFSDIDLSGLELGLVMLEEKLLSEVRSDLELPVTVVFCGGTNTGKSTLVNSLAGRQVSPSGSTASLTKRIIGGGEADRLKTLVEGHRQFRLVPLSEQRKSSAPRHAVYAEVAGEWPRGLPVLLDTPDIDSSDTRCRDAARLSLGLADLLVWVTTQQKYKDKAGIRFLEEAMELLPKRIDVFNQALARHLEALEDLVRDYDERWPNNERTTIRIDEEAGLGEGNISPARLAPLLERIRVFGAMGKALKTSVIRHGLKRAGGHLIRSAEAVQDRYKESVDLAWFVRSRFEKNLFEPLRNLPGHEAPFELQAAIVRVLGPRIRTSVGDLLHPLISGAGSALTWAVKRLPFGSGGANPQDQDDPTSARDRIDLEAARKIIENARFDLLEKMREQAARGSFLFKHVHSSLKHLDAVDPATLAERLNGHLENARKESLARVVERFEGDLEEFCRDNPNTISVMRAVIPGFSLLAGFAAAVFSVHTFAVLPGAMEYLLGGVAIPVFRHLKGVLPPKLIEFADRLSKEPFIQRSREEFAKTRRAVFLEAGNWLALPVERIVKPVEVKYRDVKTSIRKIEHYFNVLYKEQ